MKKLLSIILATTMIFALLPSFALAADTEGVLDYKITCDVIKTDILPDSYTLPGHVTTNLGKLSKTGLNVIKALSNTTSQIVGSESQFVSYRDSKYYLYSTTPVRKPVSGTEMDQTVEYSLPATLDLTKTAPYELMGGTYADNTNMLDSVGVYLGLKIGTSSDEDAYATKTSLKQRPNYIVRIKVDESQKGKYKLSAYNNYSYNEDGKIKYGENNYKYDYATKGYHSITQVSFVKISDDFEFLHDKDGKAVEASASNGGQNLNTYDKKAQVLGNYSSEAGNNQEFDTILDVTAGEYIVIFQITSDTLKSQSESYAYGKSYIQNFLLSGIKLTPAVSEEETAMKNAVAEEVTEEGLSNTSYVNVITASVESNDAAFETTTKKIEATRGENVTVTADTVEGYDFLYWRSGLGADAKVITDNPECTVKAIPGTWLTAVYKAVGSEKVSVLFYNADGDIIKNELVDTDTAITFPSAPTAPAGCGAFTGWALNTKENIVSSATATGNSMVFVAQFEDDTEKNITVTVPTGAAGGGDYAYGEPVTVNAEETSDNKNFAYWKKGDEVVSFDRNYTFRAWESCSLTAVYLDTVPDAGILRKIIIKGNVAEFIGLDAAVEKGVIFRDTDATQVTLGNATHKIAMTTDGNHLAFINDLEKDGKTNCTGYAILENGNVIYDK